MVVSPDPEVTFYVSNCITSLTRLQGLQGTVERLGQTMCILLDECDEPERIYTNYNHGIVMLERIIIVYNPNGKLPRAEQPADKLVAHIKDHPKRWFVNAPPIMKEIIPDVALGMAGQILYIIAPYRDVVINLSGARDEIFVAGYLAACVSQSICEAPTRVPLLRLAPVSDSQEEIMRALVNGPRGMSGVYSIEELLFRIHPSRKREDLAFEAEISQLEREISYLEASGYISWALSHDWYVFDVQDRRPRLDLADLGFIYYPFRHFDSEPDEEVPSKPPPDLDEER
jgi:hypothetical protein